MSLIKKLLKKTDVKKNLLITTSFTALSQVIHLVSTPVLTRLYTPEAIGKLSIFIAITGLFTSLSTFKYDQAIMVSQKDEVLGLHNIIRRISLFAAVLGTFISIIVFSLGLHEKAMMIFMCTIGGYVGSTFWSTRTISNRLGEFRPLGITKIIENTINAMLAIILGKFFPSALPLMFSKISGVVSSEWYLKFHNKKHTLHQTQTPLLEIAKKYVRFPRYNLASDVITHINLSLLVMLFTTFFGDELTGHIGLSTRVLSMPINFIGLSVLDVFRHKAVHDYKQHGSFETIFVKFFFLLLSFSIPIILILSFKGPEIFGFIFGNNWILSGTFSKYLVYLYAIRLMSSPLSYSFNINGNQQKNLFYQSFILIMGCSALITSYFLTHDPIICIQSYTFATCIAVTLQLCSAYQNSKIKRTTEHE